MYHIQRSQRQNDKDISKNEVKFVRQRERKGISIGKNKGKQTKKGRIALVWGIWENSKYCPAVARVTWKSK